MRVLRWFVFVFLNVAIVGGYCFAMVGRLEPLKHEPEKFVILPLMVITAAVAACLYPLLLRQPSRVSQALSLYLGFLVVAVLYGIYLQVLFPDAPPWAVFLTLVGAHLYGWPVFLLVLVCQLLLGRWLFQKNGPSNL